MKKSDAIRIIDEVLSEFNLFGKKKVEPEAPSAPLEDRRKNKVYAKFPKQARTHRSSDSPINGNQDWSGDAYKDHTSMRTTPVNQESPRRSTDSPDRDYTKELGPYSRKSPVNLQKHGINPFSYDDSKKQNYEYGVSDPWIRGTERRSKQDPKYRVKEMMERIIKEEIDRSKKVIKEGLSEKGIATVAKWCSELGCQEAAIKLINYHLTKIVGIESDDLPDSVTYMHGVDNVNKILSSKNYTRAFDIAKKVALKMMKEEGFEG